MNKNVGLIIEKSYNIFKDKTKLKALEPKIIRAGIYGGLPWDCQTTDVVSGCLSFDKVCYANCFVAREAFKKGIAFGARQFNILNKEILKEDLNHIDCNQKFLRNGWNSDPSWNWKTVLELCKLVREKNKHIILNTKFLIPPAKSFMKQFLRLSVEFRVSLSALDKRYAIEQKMDLINEYKKMGGLVIPVLISAKFTEKFLVQKQNDIVKYITENDLPGSEIPLRVYEKSPMIELIDLNMSTKINKTKEIWFGLLYKNELCMPCTSSTSKLYTGLSNNKSSKIDRSYLKKIWVDPFPTHEELKKTNCIRIPEKIGYFQE